MHLVATLTLLFQDKPAEEAFKKIEEVIGQAKTVSFKFRSEAVGKADGNEIKSNTSGSVSLKGNRVLMSFRGEADGRVQETKFGSDGTRFTLWSNGRQGTEAAAYDTLGRRIQSGFVRGGMAQMDLILPMKAGQRGKQPKKPDAGHSDFLVSRYI